MMKKTDKPSHTHLTNKSPLQKLESQSTFQFHDNRKTTSEHSRLVDTMQRLKVGQDQPESTAQFVLEEEEELGQMKANSTAMQLEAKNNTGLPDNLKSGMESLSGMSLDHVKVHYNSPKPAAVQAHAYAQGSDIHIASGQEKHLPHELGHVVQQAQGRVQPTTSVGGMQVNDNPSLESEATSMGDKALQMFKKGK